MTNLARGTAARKKGETDAPGAAGDANENFGQDAIPEKTFTLEELHRYDGKELGLPVYVAVKGMVFDVTAGAAKFYGPGKPYSKFAGRDITRNTAMFSTLEKDLDRRDYPPEKQAALDSESPPTGTQSNKTQTHKRTHTYSRSCSLPEERCMQLFRRSHYPQVFCYGNLEPCVGTSGSRVDDFDTPPYPLVAHRRRVLRKYLHEKVLHRRHPAALRVRGARGGGREGGGGRRRPRVGQGEAEICLASQGRKWHGMEYGGFLIDVWVREGQPWEAVAADEIAGDGAYHAPPSGGTLGVPLSECLDRDECDRDALLSGPQTGAKQSDDV